MSNASARSGRLYPAGDLSAPIQHNGPRSRAARLLRFLPAALAAYELRYLVVHLVAYATTVMHAAGSGSATLGVLALLAAGAAMFLRESGRGLAVSVPRPGWSRCFVGSWLFCSVALAVLLVAANLLHALPAVGHAQPLGLGVAAAWPTVPAVLLAGLVLAASLRGARLLWFELVRLCRRTGSVRAPLLALRVAVVERRCAAAPLRAGWSDRGPPARALAAF